MDSVLSFSISKNLEISFQINPLICLGVVAAVLLLVYLITRFKKMRFPLLRSLLGETEVSFDLKFFKLSGKLFAYPPVQKIAWQLYIQLATRVSAIDLPDNEGILKEALDSLYETFKFIRTTLSEAGPELNETVPEGGFTLADLTIIILNKHLRIFLTRWHPQMEQWESKRPPGVSVYEHEQDWNKNKEMREDLKQLHLGLQSFVDTLYALATKNRQD